MFFREFPLNTLLSKHCAKSKECLMNDRKAPHIEQMHIKVCSNDEKLNRIGLQEREYAGGAELRNVSITQR